MTLDEIEAIIAMIQSCSDDNEKAHILEDELYIAVLRAIADGAPNPVALATAALKTQAIKFTRWHA